ncbi:MAG: type II secretion system protein [Armatimonadetes bacterium]|nr:type II secretion system protein [Armatimonadota bacterium]MDE2206328.1 type II secretion system protein [Armatimonadota bacterium]
MTRTFATKHRRRGFTLIELLVVILILSCLMAIALPIYLGAVAYSERKVCRANLQVIAFAIQSARVRAMSQDYSAYIGQPIGPGTEPDLATEPRCPSGGVYSVVDGSSGDASTFKVACTLHGTYELGQDNQ